MPTPDHSCLLVIDSPSLQQQVTFAILGAFKRKVWVTEAADGLTALRRLESNKFALIITKANLPNMSGFKLIKQARADPAHKSTPVILLVGATEDAKVLEGILQLGGISRVAIPAKPADIQILVAKVKELLKIT